MGRSKISKRGELARERLVSALSSPLEMKVDAELARSIGMSPEDVQAMVDDPDFRAEVNRELDRRRAEARAAVWRALIREAIRGSFQHIKLYLELVGDLKTRPESPDFSGSPVIILRPGDGLLAGTAGDEANDASQKAGKQGLAPAVGPVFDHPDAVENQKVQERVS